MAGEHITEDKHRCFRCGQSHPDTFACPSDPLTPKERSNELRAFADILRDTGRYGVDFADIERASLLSATADELDRQRAEIERLTKERDEWAAKWHAMRMRYAELKFPGMTKEIRAKLPEEKP